MKFTREHGVVRARIDCANPQAIPRRLDHYYDGEGFTLYFDVEAPDGSIVPAGEFDIGDGEEDDKQNPLILVMTASPGILVRRVSIRHQMTPLGVRLKIRALKRIKKMRCSRTPWILVFRLGRLLCLIALRSRK
jgi:hypothetical protein